MLQLQVCPLPIDGNDAVLVRKETHLRPLVEDGCPTVRLQRAVVGWTKLGLAVAAGIAAMGGAGYVIFLALSALAGAIAVLAAGLYSLGVAIVMISVGVPLLRIIAGGR